MHSWGDENVDWAGIGDSCDILYKCKTWGRLGGQIKEKYGTVRFYASFGHLSLHTLIYPGHYYIRFPEWLYQLDNKIFTPILNFFFGKLFFWWQKKVYSHYYHVCLKKYPHLAKEILSCAVYPEYIKGCTYKEGNLLHIMDLKGNVISTWETQT